MVNAVKGFAVVNGYGGCAVGGLLLVESLGDGCCEWEESCRG